MKRLIDEDLGTDSPLLPLAKLLRGVSPLAEAPVARRSALACIEQTIQKGRARPASAAYSTGLAVPSGRGWAWGAGLAAALLSAVAAANVVRHYSLFVTPTVSRVVVPTSSSAPLAPEVSTSPVISGPVRSIDPTASLPDASVVETPSVRLKLATKGMDRSRRLGEGEDPTVVLEAIAALRDRGDATRASALLAEQLRTHPHGVLSEDALALAIEAAIARHDSRAAADLGRRYVSLYPSGRYRAFASRAVEP